MKHTKTLIRLMVMMVLAALVLVACGNGEQADTGAGGSDAAQADSGETSGSDSDAGADETVVEDDGVVIVEMFTRGGRDYNDPLGIHVEPGTTIRFVQQSGTHTVTAYHPDNGGRELRIPEGADPFDSGVMTGRGAEYEITLTEEGVYDYVCTLHEARGHVGRIVVGDPEAAPAKPADSLPGMAAEHLLPVEEIVEQQRIAFE